MFPRWCIIHLTILNPINCVFSLYRCFLWHCHCRCPCSPLPGLQVWWSAACPQQIWSREKEVGQKNTLYTGTPWCLVIQDTCWGGNRLVLTKEFNLGIIDSDRQICPQPMDLIFQAPYSYLQPSSAGFRLELHCLWQLNLTGGNRHDGKGLLIQKFLCAGSFPWQASFLPPEVVY